MVYDEEYHGKIRNDYLIVWLEILKTDILLKSSWTDDSSEKDLVFVPNWSPSLLL